MEIGKQLFGKLSTLAVSVPVSQELIQKALSERINELEDIQVVITPDHIDLSGSVHIKKFGLSRKQRVSILLSPNHVESRTIYFNVLKVKPLDFETSNASYLTKAPFTHYENRILRLDLSSLDFLQKTKFGSLRHLQLDHEQLTVGMGV